MKPLWLLACVWLCWLPAVAVPPSAESQKIAPAADQVLALVEIMKDRPPSKPEQVSLSTQHKVLGHTLLGARRMTALATEAEKVGSRRASQFERSAIEHWQKLLPDCSLLIAASLRHCDQDEHRNLVRLREELTEQVQFAIAELQARPARRPTAPPASPAK